MSYYERTYRIGFGGGLTPAIKYLLISNTAVFLLSLIVGAGSFSSWFGMTPGTVFSEFRLWQFFTYMFIHAGPWHLIFNMFFLWMFGCEVERTLGTREFVKYYLACGVGAALLHLIVSFLLSSSGVDVPVVGASGAIYGVMAAFAVLFPERVITLLLFLVLPVQLKAKYLVMIFAGISVLLGTVGAFGNADGVAHFAHLGGMVAGFLYLKLDWRTEQVGQWVRQQRESRRVVQGLKQHQAMQQIRERVDEILDKINEVGYEQLDEEEKRILREASQKFSEEKEPE